MNLYLLSQDVNNEYDTYDSAVVAALSEDEARMIHPRNYSEPWDGTMEEYSTWCNASDVRVTLIGVALESQEAGVILASFNAG